MSALCRRQDMADQVEEEAAALHSESDGESSQRTDGSDPSLRVWWLINCGPPPDHLVSKSHPGGSNQSPKSTNHAMMNLTPSQMSPKHLQRKLVRTPQVSKEFNHLPKHSQALFPFWILLAVSMFGITQAPSLRISASTCISRFR